jgi:polysaccharide pyruvyl transferase WcaK-like protein
MLQIEQLLSSWSSCGRRAVAEVGRLSTVRQCRTADGLSRLGTWDWPAYVCERARHGNAPPNSLYTAQKEDDMRRGQSKRKKVAFFGHFDSTNFGNESTLQAILYHLRRFHPDSEVICISTGPDATIATHRIEAIPVSERWLVRTWAPQNILTKTLRKVCLGLPSEAYGWVKGLIRLRHTQLLIIPGTGLLSDAYGLLNWGPYNLFKWSLIAKACRGKLALVSVGAGPIYGALGRWFVKSILFLADFRSYRDNSTKKYLESIGFRTDNDRVYPDLAFSLPETVIPSPDSKRSCRSVVGIGVMVYTGKYSDAVPNEITYLNYLQNLVTFVKWLLENEYDIRLLISDLDDDIRAMKDFRTLIAEHLTICDQEHVIDEPIRSVEDLLSQIVATDIVVATRFHNVLLSLLCNRPVISISFHQKCDSLMTAMELSEYCIDIHDLKADILIEKFCDLAANADEIKPLIEAKTGEFRATLDEQYKFLFDDIYPV